MRILFIVLAIGAMFATNGLLAEAPPAGIPNDVTEAHQKTSNWINSLKGKSSAQIVADLGDPSDRTNWELAGRKELKMRYNLQASKGTLELYFVGDRVITVSLQLLSN